MIQEKDKTHKKKKKKKKKDIIPFTKLTQNESQIYI